LKFQNFKACYDSKADNSWILEDLVSKLNITKFLNQKVQILLAEGEPKSRDIVKITVSTKRFKDFDFPFSILVNTRTKVLIGNDLINLLELEIEKNPDAKRIKLEKQKYKIQRFQKEKFKKDPIRSEAREEKFKLLKPILDINQTKFKEKTKVPPIYFDVPEKVKNRGAFILQPIFSIWI
jgi:hypothetical protein